ncbi:MFS transporter [Streptomyces rubellomurinus]|uniref:MFS transporter permease n=1 Tax=Streptomyces rubellomurinus (strain ATCC 31215) TaxID=359131 RepID=A0A0F2TCM5_STRR3|nr:MFS transporter [Streptomyces rubellomurinus]KJS60938.1 MFS transporter permease [Streptomyces rubellomurinus]
MTGTTAVPADRAGRSLRPLVGVLAATAVSLTGTRVSAIALPWFVLATTGSATMTGLVAFAEMTPYVLVKALTGPLVDRLGPRVVSWTTDAVSAVAAGLVPLLHAQGLLPFWLLLAMVAVIGAMRGPGDLAKSVMVPEAADYARVPLERATGLSGVTERLASTIGPAVGGGLVALVGPLSGLALNAATFALGSLIIAFALPRGMGRTAVPTAPGEGEPDSGGEQGGYWRMLGAGFGFLRAEPLLLTVIVMVGITNLLDAGFSTVLVPVWARESGNGPGAIGLIGSAMGVAAVVGSLIAAAVAHRLPRRTVFLVGFLVAGAPRFLVLASGAPMGVVLTVFAIGGFGSGFLNPILGAVLFERVPRHLLGRVHALSDSLAWAGIPLGGLVAGAVVAMTGLIPALVAGGAAYFVTTTVAGLRREWREMDGQRGGKGTVAESDAEPVAAAQGAAVPAVPAGS